MDLEFFGPAVAGQLSFGGERQMNLTTCQIVLTKDQRTVEWMAERCRNSVSRPVGTILSLLTMLADYSAVMHL